MFYKNGRIQSHDNLKQRNKHRSEERNGSKIVG